MSSSHTVFVVHGVLMLIAWGFLNQVIVLCGFCASLRVGIPSHYFSSHPSLGQVHVFFGGVSLVLTLLSFLLALIQLRGISLNNSHNVMGLLLIFAMTTHTWLMYCIGDGNLLFRPKLHFFSRPPLSIATNNINSNNNNTSAATSSALQTTLRTTHRLLGYITSFFGLYLCFSGVSLLGWSLRIPLGLLVFWVVVFAISCLLLPPDMHERGALGFDMISSSRHDDKHDAAFNDLSDVDEFATDANALDPTAPQLAINIDADLFQSMS